MKVELYIEDHIITDLKYLEVRGKDPLPTKIFKQLEKLIDEYKYIIVEEWINYFVFHSKPFDDGKLVVADFEEFLKKSANPLFLQFLNSAKFYDVELDEYGALVWGDDKMDINPLKIYDEHYSISEAILKKVCVKVNILRVENNNYLIYYSGGICVGKIFYTYTIIQP